MKKVAFIITVYKNDNPSFFKEAIDSIVNQDYGFENINIYLGIDGDLKEELNTYIQDNELNFYKIVRNPLNKGLAYTLNRLIEVLENESYIFRMDSDDICALNRVSTQVNFLDSNRALVVGSDLIEIDEQGKKGNEKKMPIGHDNIIKYSIARSPLNHPSVAFKKSFFNQVGLYNEEYIKAQDYELWSRALINKVGLANISEPLLFFRITEDYMKKRNSKESYINEFKVSIRLMKYFEKYHKFPIIVVKLLVRLMPYSIGKFFYNLVRS